MAIELFVPLGEVGKGAMGLVYEALDRERGVKVALKTLRIPNAEAILSLKNEFRHLQAMSHPNVVTPRELFEVGGKWFYAMDLVEGMDFLSYVRPKGQLDDARLRSAMTQLTSGLCALHADHKVHRDVKPSNVLVDESGATKLVDFGVVRDLADDREDDGRVVGTVNYMAPEQAGGENVGPAADWYALGVMLYQALTGKLPFVGSVGEIIARKWTEAPPSLLDSAPRAPNDLRELCVALLRIDPAERLEGDEILVRLGGVPRTSPRAPVRADAFVGRIDELGVMVRAFERACAGATVTLLVEGESGVGKSALMRELTGRLAARSSVLLLRGRCYERESLPYKAIDSLMDELARYLASLPESRCAALLPDGAAALRSTFPVLEIVPSLLALPSAPAAADPHEARARMFALVRALFIKVSRASRIVMSIDDLQWADEDSLTLLTEVLRQGGPSLLLLASIRSASVRSRDALGHRSGSRPAS